MSSASIHQRLAQHLALYLKHRPRQMRVVNALMSAAFVTREEVDRLAGVSNGPDEIHKLRRAGLAIPGERVRPGRYSLTQFDRRQIGDAIGELKGGAV